MLMNALTIAPPRGKPDPEEGKTIRPDCRGFLAVALYLIRPDGYVALADPQADPERLRDYFRTAGMTVGAL